MDDNATSEPLKTYRFDYAYSDWEGRMVRGRRTFQGTGPRVATTKFWEETEFSPDIVTIEARTEIVADEQ